MYFIIPDAELQNLDADRTKSNRSHALTPSTGLLEDVTGPIKPDDFKENQFLLTPDSFCGHTSECSTKSKNIQKDVMNSRSAADVNENLGLVRSRPLLPLPPDVHKTASPRFKKRKDLNVFSNTFKTGNSDTGSPLQYKCNASSLPERYSVVGGYFNGEKNESRISGSSNDFDKKSVRRSIDAAVQSSITDEHDIFAGKSLHANVEQPDINPESSKEYVSEVPSGLAKCTTGKNVPISSQERKKKQK